MGKGHAENGEYKLKRSNTEKVLPIIIFLLLINSTVFERRCEQKENKIWRRYEWTTKF
jgi:hypothetical protein